MSFLNVLTWHYVFFKMEFFSGALQLIGLAFLKLPFGMRCFERMSGSPCDRLVFWQAPGSSHVASMGFLFFRVCKFFQKKRLGPS